MVCCWRHFQSPHHLHTGVLSVPTISIQSIEDPSSSTEWFFDIFPPYEQRTARQYTVDAPDHQGLVLYFTEECCPGDAYQVDVVGSNGVQAFTATTAGGEFGDCQNVPTNGWDACTRNTDFATATYTSGVYSRLALLLPPSASYVVTVSVYRDRTPESSNPVCVILYKCTTVCYPHNPVFRGRGADRLQRPPHHAAA